MSVSRIGSLFAANVDSVQSQPNRQPAAQQTQQQPTTQAPGGDSDAVRISTSVRGAPTPPVESGPSKFESIRAQVQSGKYSSDSEKVARALVVDIF